MKEIGVILIAVIYFLTSACNNVNKASKSATNRCNYLVAWSEDTLMKYQFMIYDTKHFAYLASVKDSLNKILLKEYKGVFQNTKDRIYLNYQNDSKPKGLCTYLVKEISGSYLIQNFQDSSTRIFMRVSDIRVGKCF